MAFTIKSLKDLTIHKDENGDEYVLFSEFTTLLKSKRQPGESQIRNSNVFSWLKGKDQAVQRFNGQSAFRVQTVVHFCFAHYNQFDICRHITMEIQRCIVKPEIANQPNVNTVFKIYKVVSEESVLDKEIMEKVTIDERSLVTLSQHYKDDFNSTEWQRICFFEYHFQRSHSIDLASESYDGLLSKKALFLENFKDILDVTIKM